MVVQRFLNNSNQQRNGPRMYLAIQPFIGVMWINARPPAPPPTKKKPSPSESSTVRTTPVPHPDRRSRRATEPPLRRRRHIEGSLYTGEISGGIEIPADVEERLRTGPVVETYRDERHADGYHTIEVQRADVCRRPTQNCGTSRPEKLIDVPKYRRSRGIRLSGSCRRRRA